MPTPPGLTSAASQALGMARHFPMMTFNLQHERPVGRRALERLLPGCDHLSINIIPVLLWLSMAKIKLRHTRPQLRKFYVTLGHAVFCKTASSINVHTNVMDSKPVHVIPYGQLQMFAAVFFPPRLMAACSKGLRLLDRYSIGRPVDASDGVMFAAGISRLGYRELVLF